MALNICFRCSKKESDCIDCCTYPFLDDGFSKGFPLSLSDVARICKQTKKLPESFCEIFKLSKKDWNEVKENYPFVSKLYINRKRIQFKSDLDQCPFLLKGKGCSIFDVRPKLCKLTPFWFRKKGNEIEIYPEWADAFEEEDCLILKENYKNKDLNYLLSLINEKEESMKSYAEEYIKEIEFHAKFKDQLEKKSIKQVLLDNGYLD